ncbi:MAG TPA: glycosyl hydrolase 108 family protein [bacterium]|nr:glycosyl hydrolase 108 family protein [bacterium]
MTAKSNAAFTIISAIEGGDKLVSDSGGLTKYGISAKANPGLDIANLTWADAADLFEKRYWNLVRGEDLPAPLALYVADAAFNQGGYYAALMLQGALGVQQDGVIGINTLLAVAGQDLRQLCATYMASRAVRYTNTVGFDLYGRGWLRRLFLLASPR